MSESKRIAIFAVNTPGRFFVSIDPFTKSYNYNYDHSLGKYLFDGVQAQRSFHERWGILTATPLRVSHIEGQPNTNHRYRLKDEALASERFPLEFKRDVVAKYVDYSWVWKDEFSAIESLYTLIWDSHPDIEINYEFEINILMSLDTVSDPPKMNYATTKNMWDNINATPVSNDNVIHQLLDVLIFPQFIVHETPCRLSSLDSYKVIREYVKLNIDPALARITSDYDFCFTVQRRIPLAKPVSYQMDVNLFSRRRPKFVKKLCTERLEEVFEMTHTEAKYKGYTVIGGFEGKNEIDLKEQIDLYLAELMAVINKPYAECAACGGTGVVCGGKDGAK